MVIFTGSFVQAIIYRLFHKTRAPGIQVMMIVVNNTPAYCVILGIESHDPSHRFVRLIS